MRAMRALWLLLVGSVIGCGSSATTPDMAADLTAAGPGVAGTYPATYSGPWQNTTPNTLSGANTASGTVTVSDTGPNEVTLVWTLPPNPPSGAIVFVLNGSTGTLKQGTGVGGSCFSGVIN